MDYVRTAAHRERRLFQLHGFHDHAWAFTQPHLVAVGIGRPSRPLAVTMLQGRAQLPPSHLFRRATYEPLLINPLATQPLYYFMKNTLKIPGERPC
jgi:hypothetical protein